MLLIEEGTDHIIEDRDELPYDLREHLGHGHSGSIHKVQDRNTGRFFAQKTIMIPSIKKVKEERKQFFRNEVDIIRGLDKHRHIIQVFATYIMKDRFGIILYPVAEDGDLAKYLERHNDAVEQRGNNEPCNYDFGAAESMLRRAFGCLASGLAFMREERVRHKDIKPHNILVHNGSVLFTDFGYSRDCSLTNSASEGRPAFLSRRYSAPEVIDYDTRSYPSDVFSLGCVFMEILSALFPAFRPDSDAHFANMIQGLHIQLGAAQIPADMSFLPGVITLMTLKDPNARATAQLTYNALSAHDAYSCRKCCLPPPQISDPDNLSAYRRVHSNYVWDDKHKRYKCVRLYQPAFLMVEHEWMPLGWQPPLLIDQPEHGEHKRIDTPHSPHPNLLSASITTTPSLESPATTSSASQLAYPRQTGSYNTASYYTAPPRYSYAATVDQPGYSNSGYINNYQTSSSLYGTSPAPISAHHHGYSNLSQLPGANINSRRSMPKGRGRSLRGTYKGPPTLHYEELDHSYYVRNKAFFFEGRVFSIILSENAGAQASDRAANAKITDYTTTSTINEVMFKNNYIYTTMRRFVVVRQKREFCFACPIFTYSGKATTKHGVRPAEHGIIYTWGKTPQLLPGETGIEKASLSVVMAPNEPPLHEASRIYYGIHHPIQYNVKVKEIGYVPRDKIPVLIGQWREEDDKDTEQSSEVTADGPLEEIQQDEEDDEEENEEM